MMSNRVKWVDVARFFGIFAIYIGHYAELAGNAYYFVFNFHVPLFFFISGCMSNYDHEENLGLYLIKKVKALLLPFWFFCFSSLVFWFIQYNADMDDVGYMLSLVAKGCIRNTFFVDGLWFLTCLFLIDLLFKLIKQLKNRIFILGICTVVSVLSITMINPSPLVTPHWFYNLDSALYYIFFYAVGYAVYPLVLSLFRLDSTGKKCFFLLFFFMTMVYAVSVYAGSDYVNHISARFQGQKIQIIFDYARNLLLIAFFIFLSKLFENITIWGRIGSETLFLCGNEYLIKSGVLVVLNTIGLENHFLTPMHIFVYSFLLLLFGVFIWIPFHRKLYSSLENIFVFQKRKA